MLIFLRNVCKAGANHGYWMDQHRFGGSGCLNTMLVATAGSEVGWRSFTKFPTDGADAPNSTYLTWTECTQTSISYNHPPFGILKHFCAEKSLYIQFVLFNLSYKHKGHYKPEIPCRLYSRTNI